jgi:DNA-directed RNA polymerase I, II, and III subunit RPABC1
MSSNTEFEYANIFYRSRQTLMELLESRGYEVGPYKRFSPKETTAMSTYLHSADFIAPHSEDPERKCLVLYMDSKPKGSMSEQVAKRMKEPELSKLDVIIMYRDAIGDAFAVAALNDWLTYRMRVSYFSIYSLANNPTKHVLVPPHEKVPEEEHEELLAKLMVNSKSQLPHIKFHIDMQARWLGLVPGDIVKITRPSPSAGVYTVYRVCTV